MKLLAAIKKGIQRLSQAATVPPYAVFNWSVKDFSANNVLYCWSHVFSCEFCESSKSIFFTEHLRATATHFCSDSFPVTNFRCYRNAYISIFLHRAARLWDLCLWNVFMVWASLGVRSWAGVCRGVGGSCGIMGNQGTLISAFA